MYFLEKFIKQYLDVPIILSKLLVKSNKLSILAFD